MSTIYAIDFDGTICESKFPEIGEPKKEVIEFIRKIQSNGDKWILWTMREGLYLNAATHWLLNYGLIPNAINDNLQELKAHYGNNPRKIYADVYIDDRNSGGLKIPE